MNHNLDIPLQQLALMKIATHIWSKPNQDSNWADKDQRAKDRINLLRLPESLKQELRYYIDHVTLEVHTYIISLIEHELVAFRATMLFVNNIQWTSQGYIDANSSVEILFKSENYLSAVDAFKLSCVCCLEKYIPVLWLKLGESEKMEIMKEADVKFDFWRKTVEYWDLCMTDISNWNLNLRNITSNDSKNIEYFKLNVQLGNEFAVKYAWDKISFAGKKKFVPQLLEIASVKIFPSYFEKKFFVFLLNQMRILDSENEQNLFLESAQVFVFLDGVVFKKNIEQILRNLLKFVSDTGFLDLLVNILCYKLGEKGSTDKYTSMLKLCFQFENRVLESAVYPILEMEETLELGMFCKYLRMTGSCTLLDPLLTKCLSETEIREFWQKLADNQTEM